MFPCQGCTRHVRDDSRQCPFCGASLRSGPSPIHGGVIGAILGLALVGCGEPDPGDEEGASTVANTSAATDSASTGNVTVNGSEAEAADYGGPEGTGSATASTGVDTGASTDTGQEAEAADYGGPESTGSATTATSGTDTGTGTGTSGG